MVEIGKEWGCAEAASQRADAALSWNELEGGVQSKLQFPEESRLSQELEGHHLSQQSNADSVSLLDSSPYQ